MRLPLVSCSLLASVLSGSILLAAGTLAAAAAPATLTDDQENDAIVYAWDNAVFTLYHEIGHMLVDLYELPVLAREEDAVDNLATLMALDDYNRDGDPIIIDAAYGWMAWMKSDDFTTMSATDFFDEHSINTQRAYQMICILVGSDREDFGDIGTRFGLDADRQESCEAEFTQTKASWDAVLKPHRVPNAGEPMISILYDDASEATTDGRDILIDNEVLETVAKTIEKSYTLPRKITFQAADCGAVNAFYSSGDSKIIICYELVEDYYDQYRRDLLAGNDPTAMGATVAADDGTDGTPDTPPETSPSVPATAPDPETVPELQIGPRPAPQPGIIGSK